MVDMEEEPLLKPMVLWAQRKEMVLLRVKIQPTEVSIWFENTVHIICVCRNQISKYMTLTWSSKVKHFPLIIIDVEYYFIISGVGIGASGKNWYGFELVFYESVDTKVHSNFVCICYIIMYCVYNNNYINFRDVEYVSMTMRLSFVFSRLMVFLINIIAI